MSGEKDSAPALLKCSFCQKSQAEVTALIAGPSSLICDECVRLCTEIIDEAKKREKPLLLGHNTAANLTLVENGKKAPRDWAQEIVAGWSGVFSGSLTAADCGRAVTDIASAIELTRVVAHDLGADFGFKAMCRVTRKQEAHTKKTP